MRFSTLLLSAIVLASMLALPATGGAAPPAEPVKKAKENKPQDKSGEKKPKRRAMPKEIRGVQELEALEIVGRIQKPEVFYVLGRTDFGYKGLSLKKSFVDRIRKSVRRNPF